MHNNLNLDQMPLFSICTGCYNHEQYLRDYFASIMNQTYPNIELIISDDVSTDRSREIIEEYLPKLQEKFSRVLYIRNETNLGLVKNYHNLNLQARGKYIKPFASDDIMLPEYVETVVEYMEKHPEYALGYMDAYQVQDEYRYGDAPDKYPTILDKSYIKEGFGLFKTMLERQFIITAGMLFKREIYEKHPYDLNIGIEDQDFWLTVARNDEGIGYIPGLLICRRISVTSMSNMATGDIKKKFRFTYDATTKMYQKQLAFVDEEFRNKIWANYYAKYWGIAMDYNLREEVRELKNILKERKVKLSFRQRIKELFFKLGFLDVVKKWMKNIRERKID